MEATSPYLNRPIRTELEVTLQSVLKTVTLWPKRKAEDNGKG